MHLKFLVDNNTFIDEYYLGEPAVSYYIEDEGTKILFDVGYSDVFIKNSEKMNIDLHNINKVVISHGGMWLVSRIQIGLLYIEFKINYKI